MAHDEQGVESRRLTFCDVPNITQLTTTFVYNFFVPDERTDDSGRERFNGQFYTYKNKGKKNFVFKNTQKEVSEKTVQLRLPRYVTIEFSGVDVSGGGTLTPENATSEEKYLTETLYRNHINDEMSLTTIRDAAYSMSDTYVRSRIYDRANLLANIMGESVADAPSTTAAIVNEDPTIDGDTLQRILTPLSTDGVVYVNEIGKILEPPVFSLAAGLQSSFFADRRVLRQLLSGDYQRESVAKRINSGYAHEDAQMYLPNATTDGGSSDSLMPTFMYVDPVTVGGPSEDREAHTVGYIIIRKQLGVTGELLEERTFYLPNKSLTSYVDTEVLYGATYSYSVRTVARVTMTVPGTQVGTLSSPFQKITVLVASSPSQTKTVVTRETVPPKEPDGVFFRYNYDAGGLIIRWQIPVGKQRDVKYFQIFRRKSIRDPFEVVAELDFDNSEIKSSRAEKVDPSRIFTFPATVTSFNDTEFNRTSSYIYAVAAVDVHGLSSGYSTQTRVTFDRNNNAIDLNYISKAGAPKQYPNFFVDPDLDDDIFVDSLTQDAMMVSTKHKMRVYFDPDATTYTSPTATIISNSDPLAKPGVNEIVTQRAVYTVEEGHYKFNLINTDRQKSASVQIQIEDLGSA
jgi:hypothetical protein